MEIIRDMDVALGFGFGLLVMNAVAMWFVLIGMSTNQNRLKKELKILQNNFIGHRVRKNIMTDPDPEIWSTDEDVDDESY